MLIAGLMLLLASAPDIPLAGPLPAAAPVDNPLAPAAQGLIECANPDAIAKTCRSLARYTPQDDGTFATHAEVLLVPSEPVTITLSGATRIKGNEACSTLTTAMVKAGTLRYAGTIVPDKAAVQITPRILAGLTRAGVLDKEICSTRSPDGNGFLEKATVDGHTTPEGEAHLVWLSPDAGYTVGPRNIPG